MTTVPLPCFLFQTLALQFPTLTLKSQTQALKKAANSSLISYLLMKPIFL